MSIGTTAEVIKRQDTNQPGCNASCYCNVVKESALKYQYEMDMSRAARHCLILQCELALL